MHLTEQIKYPAIQQGYRSLYRRFVVYLVLCAITASMSLFTTVSTAADLPLFGPKRYERAQGKPWVFTDTFNGCANSAGQARIRIQNGDNADSSLSSAVINLNGSNVFVESDFKNQTMWLERTVTIRPGSNTLSTQLKSGGQKETPFLVINILGIGCDSTPPVISNPQPTDGALLNTARPTISASYGDNSGGSGINLATVRVTLDDSDITSSCTVGATAVSCTPVGNLTEGVHNVTLAVSDLLQNPASLGWRFTTDTVAPRAAIITPTNNQYLGRLAVTVSGSIDDPTATVSVNGKAATINGALFSVADVPLSEGDNTLTVIARDPAGNQTQSGVMVRVDTSLPQVTITTPIDGSFINIPTVTVNGTISESPESVLVNGRSATITGQAFTLPQFPLAEGLNSLTVVALDLAGNKGAAITTVTLDTVKPQIFISTPADGILTRNPQLTITGSVSEPVTSLTINGSVVAVSPTLTFSSTLTLNEGSNAILLKATDRAGNKGNAGITATLDSTAPNAPTLEGLTTPTNRAIVTVTGSAEPWSSVYLYNGVERVATIVTPQGGRFIFADITLNNGENSFSVTALDLAGNESAPSVPVMVTLDTAAPVVAIVTPLDKAIMNTPVITLSGNIDDPTAVVTVNGLPAISLGGIWTLEGFTLQEGSNTLLVEARDPAGNKGSATVSVTLDTVAPEVYVTAPIDGLYTNMATLSIRGQASETVAAVTINTSTTLSAGSLRAATVDGQGFTLPDLQLTEGSNTITVEATDLAGNKGTETVSVTLDTIAPLLTVIGPDDGALLNNGQITFGGAAAEPVVSVLVNGISAPLNSGTGGYTLPVTLAEGSNTLTITATDRAGNHSSSTITVNLDSIAPQAPQLNSQTTPTRIAATTVSGQAEANAQVKLFNNGQLIATLKADAAGLFSIANVTLSEGNNPFTAQAVDAAGNASTLSAPLTVVLDTKAPLITVSTPQAGAVISAAQVTIKGTVDETLASLTVNGAATPINNLSFEYVLALAVGENSALLTATDLAGNIATTTVTVQRDSTPPKVVITAPLNGLLTNTPQIQISGTVDDAEATLTLLGAAVTVTNKTFTVGYLLADGDNNIQIKGVDKAGNEGTAAVTVTLDAQAPVVTLSAPATAAAGANVSITINATDNRTLTLAELRANGMPIWSASPTSSASATETIGYRLSPDLSAGAEVTLQLRAMDAAGNEGVTTAKILISQAAAGPGYVQGKVLDDIRGLRMAGATVTVTDFKGTTKTATSGSDGGYFFEIPSGEALLKITRTGYTAVERRLAVRPEQKVTILDARLTKTNDTKSLIDVTGGVVKSAPFKIQNSSVTIDVSLPATALAAQADMRVTPVSNQGLIGTLPLGWSPLAVVDLLLLDPVSGAPLDAIGFATTATVKLSLPAIANLATSTLTLVRYDNAAHQWLAAGSATPAADGASATADITVSGQYAVVLSDPAPNAPAAAQSGQPLAAASLQSLDFSLTTATGKVIPQAAPPSAGLKAAGEVVVTVKADAAQQPVFTSGLLLGGRITEKFDLLSGDKVEPVSYTQDIVLYRYPCITNMGAGAVSPLAVSGVELRTTFPVSPSKDYTIVDLLLGKVGIEILPPDTTETGVMVGTDGGRILDADGNILLIPQGALSQTTPVSTKNVAPSAVIGADFTLLKTVEVNLTRQTLTTSATLSIPAPDGFNSSLQVIVAKGVTVKGVNKLKLVALAKQSGSFVNSDITAAGIVLPGVTTSGVYYFLQAKGQIGFVIGTISDASSNPFAGAFVKTDSGSLIDLAENSGKYLLAAPVAAFNATATDLYKGDYVTAAGTIAAANQAVSLNLVIKMVPPRVTAISPANGAANVQPSVPVVVTFSKPMDKNSINSQTLKLSDSAGTAVSSVITWNAEATIATIYPADAFKQETTYTVTVAATVKDVQGYSLGQDVVSNFTVRKTTPPVMPAAGAISGTFPDADGYISITATQGSAPTDCTILLINDASGEIVSVTPATNGSFTGKVRGQLGDEIKVVLMDYSGNQTTISYLTFKSPDGSYLVTAKGGKVEGEGGAILDIPEGAQVGPAIVKLSVMQEANLPSPLQAPGTFLGAVNIDTGGVLFQKKVDISIPLPEGFDPKTTVFVTRPSTITTVDGTEEQVYEVIDTTKVVGNRITTACWPFDGIMAVGSYVFTAFPNMTVGIVSGYTYQDMNDLPGYQEPPLGVVETPTKDAAGNLVYKYDRPVPGAVVRNSASWNYVSYTNSKGFYAHFTTLTENVGLPCKDYNLTAIHPLTMKRVAIAGNVCEPPYNLERFNFKLAEKGTIPPDNTPPSVSADIKIMPGQAPEFQMISGTTPSNTKLLFPVTIIDENLKAATLTVTFKGDDGSNTTNNYVLTQLNPPTVYTTITKGVAVQVFRYTYAPQFNNDTSLNYFLATLPGLYSFSVDAVDQADHHTILTRQVRVSPPGSALPTGREGAPYVDAIEPSDGTKNLSTTDKITIWFSEPVENITSTTVKLLDMTASPTGTPVSVTIDTRLDGNRTVVTLTPVNVLWSNRTYKVVVTTGIKDVNANATAPPPYARPDGDGKMPLDKEYTSTFSTSRPLAYDLEAQDQFTGGRDVGTYEFTDNQGAQHIYAYVAAGDQGWRVIDVTDQSTPYVVANHKLSNGGVSWNARGIAVSQDKGLLAITENIVFADGNQYGYIRFYNLTASPADPPLVGRERIAEAYTGIPGRVTFAGKYAYVANAALGVQVIDSEIAINNQNSSSSGQAIVGVFDTVNQGYSSPSDIATYGTQKALVTTNAGHLLVLDITTPYYPILMKAFKPAGYSFGRVSGLPDYTYTDAAGNDQKIDLAIGGTREKRIVTIDLSDGYNPQIIGTVSNDSGTPVDLLAYDISIIKEESIAYVTTLNAVAVIDIKNPRAPKLRDYYSQLPVVTGPQQADGTTPTQNQAVTPTPAIAVLDGSILMANQANGLRILTVNPNDIKIFNEEKKLIPEIEYSKGENPTQRYYAVVKFDDPSIECNNYDLAGNVAIKTRAGAAVNPLAGIDHPTNYLLSFRKGTDGQCYADLKKTTITSVNNRFIATNFPAAELDTAFQQGGIAPVFGSIGTKAVFEFSNKNNGKLLKRKIVPLEKLIRIAFDGNRDGKVRFDDPEDKKYTFWVNDDHDVSGTVVDSFGELLVELDDDIDGIARDADDNIINTLRDLEDFAPLQIQIDKHAQKLINFLASQNNSNVPNFSYYLQFKNVNFDPSINIFEDVSKKELQYLQDMESALQQVSKNKIAEINANRSIELPKWALKSEDVSRFIFEGKSMGSGDLVLTLKSDGVVVDETSARLDLKPISWFYDKFEVTYNDQLEQVNPIITIDERGGYKAKSNDYAMYIHGWNMKDSEKSRWVETMFKRLWWQGYNGRVGLFSWPTYDTNFNLQGGITFDKSENRAWQSAEALRDLLENRLPDHKGSIHLLGHSMGGVVVGEAIHKLPSSNVVKAYIATQTALSAHYYDNSVTERSWRLPQLSVTPNIFGYFPSGGVTSVDKPYFSGSLNKVSKAFNYFNPVDYALTAGEVRLIGWELNTRSKPDPGYVVCNNAVSCYIGTGVEPLPLVSPAIGSLLDSIPGLPTYYIRLGVSNAGASMPQLLSIPDGRYEIFSRITQSRVNALGATTQPIEGMSGYKDLMKDCDYNNEHYSHSREFRSNMIDEACYWKSVIDDFGLSRTNRR